MLSGLGALFLLYHLLFPSPIWKATGLLEKYSGLSRNAPLVRPSVRQLVSPSITQSVSQLVSQSVSQPGSPFSVRPPVDQVANQSQSVSQSVSQVGQSGRSVRSVSQVGQSGRSVRSVSQVGQSGRSVRSVSQVGQSVGQSVSQVSQVSQVGQSGQSVRSVSQVGQSVGQSVSQSVSQSVHYKMLPTSQLSSSLNSLIDKFQVGEKFCVIITSDLVSINKISVQIVQFHIAFSHIFPDKKPKLEIREQYHQNTAKT